MNGAESLVRTLVANEVNVCFTNPGTSEMHFVSALDRVHGMRCVLGLFEGVVTGAADGFFRMAKRPAATLLHLGPGLANGLANLHNAKKAKSGIVNIIGDHASRHIFYNAPLTSDIEGLARSMCSWVRTSSSASEVAKDGVLAIDAARGPSPQLSALILPADTAWNLTEAVGKTVCTSRSTVSVSTQAVSAAAAALRHGTDSLLLLGGNTLTQEGLAIAARIAGKTGCKVLAQTYNARMARGKGCFFIERIPYAIDESLELLKRYGHIVLVEAADPVAFFAYPTKPSRLRAEAASVHRLSDIGNDSISALEALADEVDAKASDRIQPRHLRLEMPSGPLSHVNIAMAIALAIPENAIVVDESITTGRGFFPPTASSAPHDWLQNMGGSIGFGAPVATGAAVACPDRKVICLVGDGSAMYTLQALWTQAREKLDVTTVVFANRTYQILRGEFSSVKAGEPGRRALDMLNIDNPTIDWVKLANGMGVEARKVLNAEEFNAALADANAKSGPRLIEVVM